MILDDETYQATKRIVAHAQRGGFSVPEQLWAQGLLLSPGLRRQIESGAMRKLASEMTQWTPPEFLRTVNKKLESATPAEMYWAIHRWILRHADHALRPPS
jgi:hypothetical protein